MSQLPLKAHIQGFLISTVHVQFHLPEFDKLVDQVSGKDRGPSKPYETMIFQIGDWHDLFCERYDTEEEAIAGHRRACEAVRNKEIME